MPTAQYVELPIEQIEVEQEFNPRSSFEITAQEELSRSIAERGLLQPLTVRQEGEKFFLIAGERRLRAAKGVLKTVPCIVQNGTSEDPGERLVDALVENLQRVDLSVAEEVQAYRRLKETHGWNAKRIAHETGLPQARVTKRMALLALPDEAIDAAAQLNDKGRKALLAIAAVDSPAAGALAQVLMAASLDERDHFCTNPANWLGDVRFSRQLPVLVEGEHYPSSVFEFEGEVAEAVQTFGQWGVYVAVSDSTLKRAAQLGALVELPDGKLIAGYDVCVQLAADQVVQAVKDRQQREETFESSQAHRDTGAPSSKVVTDPDTGEVVTDDERKKEIRSERFQAEQRRREQAREFNAALAAPLLSKGASQPLTAGTARLLAHFVLQSKGLDYCLRGLRYLHPNGKLEGGKVIKYVEGPEADELLSTFVNAARKPEEIIGRALTLVLASRYADEQCVAQSNKRGIAASSYGSPIADQTVEDELDRLLKKILGPKHHDLVVEHYSKSSPSEQGAEDDPPAGE